MSSNRTLNFPAVHFLRKVVSFDTADIATGVPMNAKLPNGAIVLFTTVNIDTVFNAVSTNVLTVGTVSTAYNNLIAAGDVDETTLGATTLTSKALKVAADTDVYIKYTQTGTAATTGAATVVVAYVPQSES